MEKVIRDGKVAVLIAPGFGGGWFDAKHPQAIFHPKLIEMVESGRREEIDEKWMEDNLGIKNYMCFGAEDLEIEWLPVGTKFRIEEYDGSEYIITLEDLTLEA